MGGGGFMSSDPSPGQRAPAAGMRRQAQDAVREWVTSAGLQGGARRWWVVPLAAAAAVGAAAGAPVGFPSLAAAGVGTGAAVVAGGPSPGWGGGGGGVSGAGIPAWGRLRAGGPAQAGAARTGRPPA